MRGSVIIPLTTGAGTGLVAMHAAGVLAVLPLMPHSGIMTAYLLTVTALLFLLGRLADRVGHRTIYIASLSLFVAASACCAIAPGALLPLRIVQAIGAAGVSATAMAIVGRSVPAHCRGSMLGWQSALTYAGLVLGAPVAGFLVQHLSWRAVFLVNVPIGVIALFMAYRFLPRSHGPSSARRAGIVWSHATRAVAGEFVYYWSLYMAAFLLPLSLMRGRGLTPAQAGLWLAVPPLVRALTAPLGGALADRIGSMMTCVAGLAAGAIALLALAQPGPMPLVVAALALLGAGTGLFVPANAHALLAAVPSAHNGTAVGILGTARNLGMSCGTMTAAAVYAASSAGAGFLVAASLVLPAVILQSNLIGGLHVLRNSRALP